MQDLKIIIVFCFGLVIINILYSYFFLNKKYKNYLTAQFKELAISLGYLIKEDKSSYHTKIIEDNIILGTDIDFQLDITKLTELVFVMIFKKSIENSFKNNTFQKFTKFIFKFNYIISIIFSIGFLINLFFVNEGFMMPAFISILLLGIISMIVLNNLHLSFKKDIIKFEEKIGVQKIELIQKLYWYIPISVFNSVLRLIDYIRWLFSKN